MISYLLVSMIIVSFLYYYLTRSFNYWKNKNVKGPKPIPLFGNFKEVALRKKHMGMLYKDIYDQYPDEKVVGLYRMTAPTLLIRDLDIVKQVLIKDFESFPDRATYYSKEGLSENMFHSDHETWKFLRHRFTSVFTSSKFKGIFHLLVNRGEKFTDYVESTTMKQATQDIYKLVLKYTVSTTMIAAFGLDIDTFVDNNRLFEIIDEELKTSYFNEMDLMFPGILTKFNLSVLARNTIKFCHQIVEASINQRLNSDAEMYNVTDVIHNLKKEREKHRSMQMDTEKEPFIDITDDLLAAQAWVFYTAGNANNTLSLTYALFYLARNTNVQDKLREEIDNVLGTCNGKLTYKEFKEMKYLELVFQETLRMHPLTNGLVRSVSQDINIEGTDIIINKGITVVVSPYSIHRDEKYYVEPEKFEPERFMNKNNNGRHPCAFLPFGTGPRSCLGSQLARIQFGICLVMLLSKFRVETAKNTIRNITYDPCRMLLTPKERIYLNIIPRWT